MTILEQAQRLVKRYGTSDPEEILRSVGVQIIRTPMTGIRGMYQRLKRNTFVFVDSRLDERTEQFVLGHELGHHLFHRGQNRLFLDRCTLLLPSRQELEADTFAVCLMAPEPAEVLFEGENAEDLAARLGVSRRAAELYLEEVRRQR